MQPTAMKNTISGVAICMEYCIATTATCTAKSIPESCTEISIPWLFAVPVSCSRSFPSPSACARSILGSLNPRI